jgi:amino acid adenylation domain-containing protein
MTRSTVSEMFAEQVARFPGNLAVIADDGTLTYQELAAKATAVAAVVRQDGGTTPVALLCRHGATTIAALLGVLIAGRPYVPLDQTFPVRRLAYQLADSGSGLLLTDDTKLASQLGGPVRVVDIDPVLAAVSAADTVDLDSPARPDDPAYLLYTSGSTGTPKGVVQNHRNIVFAAHNHIRNCGITPADRTSVLTSFGFDMAVTDMYSALLSGAAAVPIDIRTHGLAKLATLLTERGVTLYHSTPTVYRYLVASLRGNRTENRTLPAVRVVLLGGEEVNARDVRLCRSHFGPQCVFVNGYGTTEVSFIAQNHIPATAADAVDTVVDDGVIPIGRPLAGLEVILLDADGRPNPDAGEILVRSRHVALGYHGKAGLTAGNRFTTVGGERAYRTGDLARRLPNGMLAFLGRADRQVKIRGYRVEIGDVETQLADLPGVAQAAVVARRSGPHGDMALIGYVVPEQGIELGVAATTAALRDRLPEYMVPRVIVPLTGLPLTVTGKLDHDALPDPPPAGHPASEPEGLEAEIAKAWRMVLELPAVGWDDNFYEIGGHSLLMALVQQQLERLLGRKLPMATLFAYPTVRALAAHLADDGTPDRADSGRERATRRQAARARRAGMSAGK